MIFGQVWPRFVQPGRQSSLCLCLRHRLRMTPDAGVLRGMRISAAMLPFDSLKLKHHPGCAAVEIEIVPAQPERFTMP
jgi:hypothetical protein